MKEPWQYYDYLYNILSGIKKFENDISWEYLVYINKIWEWNSYKNKLNINIEMLIWYYKQYISLYKRSILLENWIEVNENMNNNINYITNFFSIIFLYQLLNDENFLSKDIDKNSNFKIEKYWFDKEWKNFINYIVDNNFNNYIDIKSDIYKDSNINYIKYIDVLINNYIKDSNILNEKYEILLINLLNDINIANEYNNLYSDISINILLALKFLTNDNIKKEYLKKNYNK